MNIKQVIKFIILGIIIQGVYTFFLGMLLGILGAFLTDMKTSLPMMSSIEQVLALLMVIPAIATSARIIYKKSLLSSEQVQKIAITTTVVSLIISSISLILIASLKVDLLRIISALVDLILTYVATMYFVKKYSSQ